MSQIERKSSAYTHSDTQTDIDGTQKTSTELQQANPPPPRTTLPPHQGPLRSQKRGESPVSPNDIIPQRRAARHTICDLDVHPIRVEQKHASGTCSATLEVHGVVPVQIRSGWYAVRITGPQVLYCLSGGGMGLCARQIHEYSRGSGGSEDIEVRL